MTVNLSVKNVPDCAAVMAAAAGSSLVAPPLLRVEVASVCLKKMRAQPRQRSAFLAAANRR